MRGVMKGLGGSAGAAALFLLAVSLDPAQAQSIFCPTAVGGQAGIAQQGGECTNGDVGAFSNAAVAAQALSDISQSSTQQANLVTTEAVAERRSTEAQSCPAGFTRRNGTCERVVAETPASEPARSSSSPGRTVTAPRRAVRPAPAPVYKAPVDVRPPIKVATWVKGYGDYERRTGKAQSSIDCCDATPGGELLIPLSLSSVSRSTTGGVVGGADITWRGVMAPGDGLIAGLLTGYMSTDTKLTTTSTSANPALAASGVAQLNAHLRGPALGAYLTYFRGGYSADLTFKADFLDMAVNFSDTLGFSFNTGGAPANATVVGSGSTSLTNYTTSGNLNYRFPSAGPFWVQPTVGFQYIVTDYSAGAAALGLADGSLLRLQGGAVFGADYRSGTYRITPSVTGLAYEDVSVTGGFVANGLFVNIPLGLSGEGKLRGQGIFTLNIDNGQGLSGFVQTDVRGGSDLFGYGGKAGLRWEWAS